MGRMPGADCSGGVRGLRPRCLRPVRVGVSGWRGNGSAANDRCRAGDCPAVRFVHGFSAAAFEVVLADDPADAVEVPGVVAGRGSS